MLVLYSALASALAALASGLHGLDEWYAFTFPEGSHTSALAPRSFLHVAPWMTLSIVMWMAAAAFLGCVSLHTHLLCTNQATIEYLHPPAAMATTEAQMAGVTPARDRLEEIFGAAPPGRWRGMPSLWFVLARWYANHATFHQLVWACRAYEQAAVP